MSCVLIKYRHGTEFRFFVLYSECCHEGELMFSVLLFENAIMSCEVDVRPYLNLYFCHECSLISEKVIMRSFCPLPKHYHDEEL